MAILFLVCATYTKVVAHTNTTLLMSDTENRNKEFLEHYKPNHQRLGKFIATMVWDTEEAKEISSETIFIALENFEKLKNKQAFVSYIFTIAVRLIRKKRKLSARWVNFDSEKWETLNNSTYEENTSDVADVYKMLDVLGSKSREAIVLFEISGFSIKEICDIQNSSASAIKSRLARARTTLQKAAAKETKSSNAFII